MKYNIRFANRASLERGQTFLKERRVTVELRGGLAVTTSDISTPQMTVFEAQFKDAQVDPVSESLLSNVGAPSPEFRRKLDAIRERSSAAAHG